MDPCNPPVMKKWKGPRKTFPAVRWAAMMGAVDRVWGAVRADQLDEAQQDPEDLREWHQRPNAMAAMAEMSEFDREAICQAIDDRLMRTVPLR